MFAIPIMSRPYINIDIIDFLVFGEVSDITGLDTELQGDLNSGKRKSSSTHHCKFYKMIQA